MNGKLRNIFMKLRRQMNYLLLKLGLKDIYFYFYIWSFIIRNKDTEEWQNHSLRHDWIGRLYTVRSVNSEDVTLPEDLKRLQVTESIRSLVDYLTQKNLSEILMPSFDKIDGTDSYLIKFVPLFYEISFWWAVRLGVCLYVVYMIYPFLATIALKYLENVSK